MTFAFKGTANDAGETYRFSTREKVTAEINVNTMVMSGTMKVTVSLAGSRSSDIVAFSEAVPAGMDGSSDLEFDIVQDDKKLVGSGTITLSNNDTYDFIAKCRDNTRKQERKVSLKGDGSSKGCYFTIIINSTNDAIKSLKGKMLGQKLIIE